MKTEERFTGIYTRTIRTAKTSEEMRHLLKQLAEAFGESRASWLDQARAELDRHERREPGVVQALALTRSLSGSRAEFDAFRLGMFMEQLAVRRHEPNALCGSKVREGGRTGHREAYGDQETKRQRVAEVERHWRAMERRELAAGRRVRVQDLDRKVGRLVGLDARTIRTYRSLFFSERAGRSS